LNHGGKTSKIIRDVVHGYISLCENDLHIIDTPLFQRLKRIRQTGAYSVYPSANHTRFEHSLGVMHLGMKVLESLGIDADERISNTVRYACLLHDIGHAPFSHLGEAFYSKEELINWLNIGLNNVGLTNTIMGSMGSPHELCSCAIVLNKFADRLLSYGVDLDLLCRMITGQKYNTSDKFTEDCLIDILNSDIDVDKLDYVLRDAFMSGAELIAIDAERLISAYTIHNGTLAFSGKALSTIGNLIYGRNALYFWVYNHHITVYTDFLFRRLIKYLIDTVPEGREELFTYESIAEKLADDYDLITFVRKYMSIDDYARDLYNQLFNRAFYKSLWKTPFEFEAIIKDPAHQDAFIRLVGQFRKEEDGLEELERRIIEANNGLTKGDFYIAVADFKPFVPVAGKAVYIMLGDKRKRFQEIFQESIFQNPFREIPYIFVKNEQVKNILVNRLNEGRLL